ARDYTLWRNNLDGDEAVLGGAGDNSGTVDIGDYGLWKAQYTALNSGGTLTVASVPEPRMAAIVILLIGFCALRCKWHLSNCKFAIRNLQFEIAPPGRRGFTLVELLV